MKNILYYLKKFGKKTFSERAFNETDSLVLASMSYMNFDGLVPTLKENKPAVPITAFTSEYALNFMLVNNIDPIENRKLLGLMQKSRRFSTLKLNYLRNLYDHDSEEQFCAVTCLIPGVGLHVCFRGTDLTLIGWKEDFNMACKNEIPAQKDAVAYLNRVAELTKEKIIIGGHSKGGNLAYYAAMHCRKTAQARIVKVFNFDGPGFGRDVFSTPEFLAIEKRAKKFVPEDSKVGMLMHHSEKHKVVKAYGMSFFQHDPYRWQVNKKGKLSITKKTTRNAAVFDYTMKDWIASFDEEKRIEFINLIFDLLGAKEDMTIVDYLKKPVISLNRARIRYNELDEQTKEYVKEQIKSFMALRKKNSKALRQSGFKYIKEQE